MPGQPERRGDVLFGRGGGEIDRLADAGVGESLQRRLHANVSFRRNVAGDHENPLQCLGDFLYALAAAGRRHFLEDALAGLRVNVCFFEGFDKRRAEVAQGQRLALVLHVAGVREREDGLATVALHTGDGGDGACRRDGELGGVANSVRANSRHDAFPRQGRTAPIVARAAVQPDGPVGRLPGQRVGIVDAALDGGEGSALLRQLDAGLHGVIADEFHQLRREILRGLAAVGDPQVNQDVRQTHDPQSDAPGAIRRLAQLGNRRHKRIDGDHVVQEAGGVVDRLRQPFPIEGGLTFCIVAQQPRQVDRSQATVLVRQ